ADVLVLDEDGDCEALVSNQAEDAGDGGVSLAELLVAAAVSGAVLDLDMRHHGVVLLQEGDGFEAGGGEVADVEVQAEVLREREGDAETLGRGDGVGVLAVRAV